MFMHRGDRVVLLATLGWVAITATKRRHSGRRELQYVPWAWKSMGQSELPRCGHGRALYSQMASTVGGSVAAIDFPSRDFDSAHSGGRIAWRFIHGAAFKVHKRRTADSDSRLHDAACGVFPG